jgi:peptide/nickel transport system permease protein
LKKTIKHPLGLTGFIIISIIVLMAILGNSITNDRSSNANLQALQIATLSPFSSVDFFIIPSSEEKNIFQTWINGKDDPEVYLPIKNHQIIGDTALLDIYYKDSFSSKMEINLKSYNMPYQIVNKTFFFGTDGYGRDVFSRIVLGSRISLLVGLVTVFIALMIGSLLGLLAGYYRGIPDAIISWFINVIWSLPTILLVVAVSFALGKGFWQIFIAIGLSSWVEVARVVRGQVFSIREKEYIQASKILGFSSMRIMFIHILPNLKSSLIVLSVSVFGTAILLESGLSFLGLGIAPPAPSWGMMIRENYQYITFDHAYLAIVPGVFIMSLVLAFNFIGIALRDALDIHLK